MAPRRWSSDHLVALVELACGVGLAVHFVALGFEPGAPDRSAADRAFPFVLAVLALAVLGTMAWRSLRRARRTPEVPRPTPVAAPDPAPVAAPGPTPGPTPVPPPPLSAAGRADVARIVAALDAAGVFAPRTPAPDDLVEAVADAGEPVTTADVLMAVLEARHWHPGVPTDEYLARLAFHDGHVEQFADTLREHVDDLDRLVGGVRADRIEIGPGEDVHVVLAVDGEQQALRYRGHPKYLSTGIHVTVARAVRARGGERLAWLWADQGVWITALTPDTDLDTLAVAPGDVWEWVDEQEPQAAGDA